MDLFFPVSKLVGFLSAPSNALLVLLAVGVVWSNHRFGRRMVRAAAAALVLFGLSPAANWLILPLEQRFPQWRETGRAPDGIVVLGGAQDGFVFGARGDLALNEGAERMVEAVALAGRYQQARIVFSGGDPSVIANGVTESDAARALFARFGVPAERISYESASRNTYENAVLARALARPQPGERWLLVTSGWLMPRAMGCFRAAGFAVEAFPVDYRTAGPASATWPFFFASEGLRRTDLAVKEWIGLAVYALTGRTSALFPAP